MSVTLLVIQGPYVGRQIQVGVGQVFRVGRTDRAEHAFPNDTYLSGAHFEVGCDEQGCRVRDLGSSNGTFINGAKVELAAVQEGDQIAAGETIFLVQPANQEVIAAPATELAPAEGTQVSSVERTERLYAPGFEPEPQEQLAPLTNERKRALHILTHHGAALFAVIDAAREGMAAALLQSSALRRQELFEGEAADPTAAHIPILVELGQAGSSSVGTDTQAFLETLLRSGWGKSGGIFCTSASPFEDLLEHFRSFLLMRTKEQRPLYFRFYDPRVLRAFLPTCEPQELWAIFGPVASYVVESDRSDMMLAFSPGADRLITAQVSLAEPSAQMQAHAG
jgi:pSer/pThr/pTyr-binding forkhead associated (FHA) protein